MILSGCLPQAEAPTDSPAASPTTTSPAALPSPETKTATISVEGESTSIELKRFDSPDFPFTTYFPASDFTEETGEFSRGRAVKFFFSPTGEKDENAVVLVFFRYSEPTLKQELEQLETDIVVNRWQVVDRSKSTPYAWARAVITLQKSTADNELAGAIYVGEHNGKGFTVWMIYPIEYAEGFLPRANLILENFQPR
jgi:hypothetical protein